MTTETVEEVPPDFVTNVKNSVTSRWNFAWNSDPYHNMVEQESGTNSLVRDVLGFEPRTSKWGNVITTERRLTRRQTSPDMSDEYSYSYEDGDEGCVEPGKWLALVSYVGLSMIIHCDPW